MRIARFFMVIAIVPLVFAALALVGARTRHDTTEVAAIAAAVTFTALVHAPSTRNAVARAVVCLACALALAAALWARWA